MSKQNWETVGIRGSLHVVTDCGQCGVTYTVPYAMYEAMWRDGGYAHCPNGHSRGWQVGHVEQEDLRRERDRLKQQIAQVQDEAKAAIESAKKKADELRRHKKRVSAGTCPCCNRTFSNMARHMETKHPEFVGKTTNVVPLKSA